MPSGPVDRLEYPCDTIIMTCLLIRHRADESSTLPLPMSPWEDGKGWIKFLVCKKNVALITRHLEPLDRCHWFFTVVLCCVWRCINLQVPLKQSPWVQRMRSKSTILGNVQDHQVQSHCRAELPPSLRTAGRRSGEEIADARTIEWASYHSWKGSHSRATTFI